MVKSSQEVLTGGDVLKTRHPAGRKWTDQFIYFGTVCEVSDDLDETMEDDSEIDMGDGDKQMAPSTWSRTKENRSNVKAQQGKVVKLTFEFKKCARSNSPLFGEMSDSDIELVGQRPNLSPETTPRLVEEPEKKRRRVVTTGTTEFATLNINDDSDVGTEAMTKVETELLKEFHSDMTKEDDIDDIKKTDQAAVAAGRFSYDFDSSKPYDFGNLDDDIVDPFPVSSTVFLNSSAMNVASSTADSRKELGSGHPQGRGSRAYAKT
ncbi:hypothetical protein F4604DRAFT_1937850 [Suillus subluteus]|nr:hypothetical protein F4604DRAFT_1937850 [Suillus subluteus]